MSTLPKVLFMAHGSNQRLKWLQRPKALLAFGEETILTRAVRLVREAWPAARIDISCPESDAWMPHVRSLGLQRRDCAPRREGASKSFFPTLAQNIAVAVDSPTLVLLADVVWSRAALRFVLTSAEMLAAGERGGVLAVYGRSGPNLFTKKPYGELFALTCQPEHRELLMLGENLWSVHRNLNALLIETPSPDWTDDVDSADDYERLPRLTELALAES